MNVVMQAKVTDDVVMHKAGHVQQQPNVTYHTGSIIALDFF